MKIRFKDIEADFFRARLSEIKEGSGAYGPYLRLIFTIIQGELKHYRFSGIVKPSLIRQGKFYRWATNILGEEPAVEFCTEDMIGKECIISLSKQPRKSRSRHRDFYSVTDVLMNHVEAARNLPISDEDLFRNEDK